MEAAHVATTHVPATAVCRRVRCDASRRMQGEVEGEVEHTLCAYTHTLIHSYTHHRLPGRGFLSDRWLREEEPKEAPAPSMQKVGSATTMVVGMRLLIDCSINRL